MFQNAISALVRYERSETWTLFVKHWTELDLNKYDGHQLRERKNIDTTMQIKFFNIVKSTKQQIIKKL